MNKNKLLELEKCSNSSLSEIQKKQGNLYSQLKQKAENQIKGSINNAFKNGSEELRRSVQSIDFDIEPDEQLDIKSKILRQLKTGKISKEVIHEAVTLLKGLTLPKTLDETLRPDIPIYQNPLFSSELEKARFYRVSDVAGLSDEEAKAVIEKRGTVTALNDKALDLLVKAGDIEKEKAKELGLVADLYRLVDGNIALTDAIKTGSFSQLRVGRVREIKDLVALERNDWLDLLNQSETDPPREMTREAYATLLRKKVETLFPGDALFGKLVPSDTEPLIESIKTLQPFYKTKDNIFSADDFTQENIMGDKFRDAYTRLKQFSNAFPGLKIAEILDEKNVLPSKKIENIEKRITILKDFLDKNSELNLLELDYTPDSKDIERLNFGGMPVEQQKMALSTVKAYQRIYTTTKDTEHTRHLIEASYDSAARIANDSLITFLDRSGLDSKRGERYYYSALNAADKTSNALESVADILRGGFNWFNVANINPSIEGYLKKIDGFEDLFESLDYCQCKHCQSIFGPAAYFVDLMCFTETHILKENFINPGKEDHVLYLKNRRPDLWDLELTCENTNELTPYLVIINEILENYIAKQRGNIANLSDRTAVEDEVYKHTLQNAERSFQLPFLLPLDKLHIYLSHFEKTPGNVAVILEEQSTIVSAASLKLSNGSYRLITRANTTPAFLGRLYGISFQVQANKIKPFDAQLLLTPMELNRAQLGELIQTDFVTGGIADKIQIMGEKTDQNSVQNDIERIYGLTYDVLDRMHRFTRLWRHVNWHIPELESNRWHYDWSIVELDIVLADLEDAHLAQGINEDALRHLTTLLKIQERFQLSVEELSSLWGQIPRKPVTKSNLSLFDRLFNIPDFVLLDGTYPQNATTFVHPSFQPANPPVAQADKALHRLMAGLRVSDEDLHLLIRNLGGPQALNLQNNGFTMTAQHLSLLYRHARLAEFLNLKIPELFHLIKLDQSIADNHISGLDDLVALLRFYDWWDSTEYELDDLGIITGGQVQDIDAYPVKDEIAKQIVVEVEKENALTFADTIFTYFDEITEEQSRKLITGNQAVIVQATNSDSNYWLSQDYDPNVQLNIPADVNLKRPEAELRKHLLNYHATNVIPNYLARKLDLSVEKTIELIGLVGADLSDQELVKELHRITDPPAKLTDLVEKVLPLSILFKNDVLNKDSLSFIRAENALFGNINFTGIEIQDIRRVTLYRNLLSAYLLGANEEVEKKEDENNKRRASIHKVILDYHANNKFSQDSEVIVGKIFGVDSGLIRTLQNQISLPSTLLEAIEKLGRCIALAKELCVGGDALKLIVSQDYDKLAQASDMILSAFRAKYKDEKEWQEKIGPFNNKILTLKRDALVAYLMSSLHPEFETTNDLYNHFLIDVELRGCARTSRVVAAISSLQVYVHRCLMNLEQDNNPGAADRVHVFPEQVPQDEWDWRKNYRVWEANRKVFLYPENYIEPELRDNKTPLFEELEAELLQQEVNEQTVLDAYAKYMRGFEEVANLKIAGSYHDKDWSDETDVLHLFGVTAKEPPIYYYRTVENAHYGEINEDAEIIWSPWRKIEVQIPVRKVAPIVFRGRLHVFWVEITTSPQNEVKSGESKFVGYKHKMSLKYTTLRLDGTWTVPQNVLLPVLWFHQDNGVVPDIFEEGQQYPRRRRYNDTRTHNEPIDSYTLDGFMWDRLYPDKGLKGEKIIVYCAGFELQFGVDFYNNEGTISSPTKDQEYLESKLLYLANLDINEDEVEKPVLLSGSLPIQFTPAGDYALLSILLEESRIVEFQYSYSQRGPAVMRLLSNNVEGIKNDNTPIAELNATDKLFLINGSLNDCIIDSNGDLLLLQGSVRDGTGYVLKRLGTTLSEEVSRKLFTGGIAALLNINSQKTLKEYDLPITPNETYIENKSSESPIDFSGPYGVYYQELLFHIPFLIANHLNSQQKFQEAQKWYHYLFNPTFSDKDDLQVGLSLKEIKVIEQDWKWQYVGFRNLGIETLRDQLENTTAIGTYKKDPFNPHAIARLRLNAYQKSIVMKYIDNLLDWGDRLFARDTMESINEATMLYTLAADILGKRPAELGECSEGEVKPKTYKKIKPLIEKDSEFLVEMEHFVWGRQNRTNSANPVYSHRYTIEPSLIETASSTAIRNLSTNKNKYSGEPIFKGMDWKRNYTAGWLYTNEFRVTEDSDTPIYSAMRIGTHGSWSVKPTTAVPAFVLSLVTQSSPIFCIPENKDLRRYWDRVEDRLYKIHHCMNISGDRRQLALFAPEIDPGLLVRTRAAGLSIEDVLNAINGDLPPYRFSYIIERAKNYAGILQGFGSALLSALEKKDVEELSRLRTLHQQNILKLTTQIREQEIDSAQESIFSLERNRDAVEYRRDYYGALVKEGLIPWEKRQAEARHASSIIRGTQATLGFLASVTHLIPQLGSPFAMKYGGLETGYSLSNVAAASEALAVLSENVAASAGLEANFQRREHEWDHQFELADKELKQIEKQLEAARIRKEIAEQSLEIHKRDMKQLKEVYDFYGDKFSNFGLYTWFSTTLQRLYREAYNSAYSMAKLTEQAFHFERGDNSEILIGASYWDASKAGLLAGEQLLIDLQNMEKRFIETNYRSLEINQSFSLTQINPIALIQLKEHGECTFDIHEIFFDLLYPGHYKRRIKSVRLTMPCITGPYTNVSATLTLTSSKIRKEPDLAANPITLLPSRTASIATSTAQNDGGVFELSFRDERYMPFEGAGAISTWKLTLPKNFRQFDYQTINDVVIHISYTAENDAALGEQVERFNAANEGAIQSFLKNNSLYRIISFRQEFSNEFNRILHSPVGSAVKIKLMNKHFPIFMKGMSLKINKAMLILRPAKRQTVGVFKISINGTAFNGFAVDQQMGGLPAKPLGGLFAGFVLDYELTIIIQDSGNLSSIAPVPGDNSALDSEKLEDIYLYLEYGIN